jgi:hypothetical protein
MIPSSRSVLASNNDIEYLPLITAEDCASLKLPTMYCLDQPTEAAAMYLSLDTVVLKNVSGCPAGIRWFTHLAFNSPDTVGLDQVFPMVAVRGRQEQRWTSPLPPYSAGPTCSSAPATKPTSSSVTVSVRAKRSVA